MKLPYFVNGKEAVKAYRFRVAITILAEFTVVISFLQNSRFLNHVDNQKYGKTLPVYFILFLSPATLCVCHSLSTVP